MPPWPRAVLRFRAGIACCVSPGVSGRLRVRQGSLLLLEALLFAAPSVHAASGAPDWVRAAAAEKERAYPASTKAIVLLDDTVYTVGNDGRATEHVRRVVRILRPQGRDFARPFVPYDAGSRISSMHVWSIDKGGHEYALKDSEFLDFGMPGEGGALYSDERARAADPPGLDPGGVVAVEYERRVRPYLSETNWFFQDGVPHRNESFTLVLPAGYHYSTTWSHHAHTEPQELPNNALRWQMDDEPAVDISDVPMSPDPFSLRGRMTVHYSDPASVHAPEGTWKGIGLWYESLAQGRTTATPEIQAKAAALVAGKTDFYDKSEAIGEFVQKNIRYFAIEIGIGGNQPHFAEEIYRGRYGDCKDKATLLTAMLSSVGIHSTYVIVDTRRGVVNPDDPSVVGNHMIAAIEIPPGYQNAHLHSIAIAKTGKRYLIFDPTWEMTPFGQLEANLQGGYGVLVEGEASQIIALPVLDPSLNRVERAGSFQLTGEGDLKGAVTELRSGDIAMERRYAFQTDGKSQLEMMNRAASRDFASFSLTDLRVENEAALAKDLTVHYELDAGHFATATGPLLMVRPRVLGSESIDTDRKPRTVAVDLGETMQAHDSFDIDLPAGYDVDELPDPVKVDFDFASYESASEVRGRTLHFSRTYTVKQVSLPAERYADLQKLSATIFADEQSRAVLKRSNALPH